jgi:hypothetical protein
MIERLNNTDGVKRSQTTAGQRELLREYRNTLNEVIDAINDHEEMLYGGPDDDCDCFCDCFDGADEDLDQHDDSCPDCRINALMDGEDECDCCDDEGAPVEPNAFFVTEDDGPLYEVVKRYKTGG